MMIFAVISSIITLLMIGPYPGNARLGDIHTSTVLIPPIVQSEEDILNILREYVQKEEEKLAVIKRYIVNWQSFEDFSPISVAENPLKAFHFFKRLARDWKKTVESISVENGQRTLKVLKKLRGEASSIPTETDVIGAAWALVHLQDVYNLQLADIINGSLNGLKQTKGLSADDCVILSEEAFKALNFESSEKWSTAAIAILEQERPVSKKNMKHIRFLKKTISKRKLMHELVVIMAKRVGSKVHNQFAGLGVPKSFEKEISGNEQAENIDALQQIYKRLCQNAPYIQDVLETKYLHCYYTHGISSKIIFQPLKTEKLSTHIDIVIYYDIISDQEIAEIQHLATPVMKTAQVKPYVNVSNRKSIARIGQSAWLSREKHDIVNLLLRRIEDMTGLSTKYADDLHVLNYGVGGHYELHIDFFDFANRNQTQTSSKYSGDQIATILFYLNDVEDGGSTVFPMINVRVKPKKGSAVVWYNLHRSGKGNFKTMHASCPVLFGQKWIATVWLNEKGQEFVRPCSINSSE